MEKYTDKELDVVGHSLGINVYHSKLSKKKKDKQLPKEFYRNRFCASEGHDDYPTLITLEENGLMERWDKTAEFFWVTDPGIEKFKQEFKELFTTIVSN